MLNFRRNLAALFFQACHMLSCCGVRQPRRRVNGRLRPYADWRSAPLTRCRGDTLEGGSKCGSFALTAIKTSGFRRQISTDLRRRQHRQNHRRQTEKSTSGGPFNVSTGAHPRGVTEENRLIHSAEAPAQRTPLSKSLSCVLDAYKILYTVE